MNIFESLPGQSFLVNINDIFKNLYIPVAPLFAFRSVQSAARKILAYLDCLLFLWHYHVLFRLVVPSCIILSV
mgnify:CR=1 FL=1